MEKQKFHVPRDNRLGSYIRGKRLKLTPLDRFVDEDRRVRYLKLRPERHELWRKDTK